MTFSAAQTGAKAGGGERYLLKRVGLAAKIETSNEVSPHDFSGEFCMIGEFGCRPDVPHDVALAWMEHCLKLWRAKNLGWALWNLRGTFGILDSGRRDVRYEDFNGHKLDRKMLELLKRY